MLPGQIHACVPSCLVFYVDMDPASGIDHGGPPTVCHKGRCHIVDGLARGITCDLLNLSIFTKVTPLHCMYKCTIGAYLSSFIVLFQIGVSSVANPVEEDHPEIPAAIVLFVCLFGNTLVPDHLCAIGATHEIYFCERFTSLSLEDGIEGCREVNIDVSCEFKRWESHETLLGSTVRNPSKY